jgi:phytoene synthase
MQDAFAYCAELVRTADQDRALATVFAPAERRNGLYALYAFNVEIGRVRKVVQEPLAGEVRLQWWRDVLGGSRAEEAQGHPIAKALLETISEHGLPISKFETLIDGRALELREWPVCDIAELEHFSRQTSSMLMELAARILDRESESPFAAPAGVSVAMTGLLRTYSQQLRVVAATIEQSARESYRSALPLIVASPASITAAWLPVALVPLYLETLVRGRPLTRLEVSSVRRMWVLWRAARRGRPLEI